MDDGIRDGFHQTSKKKKSEFIFFAKKCNQELTDSYTCYASNVFQLLGICELITQCDKCDTNPGYE